MNSNTPNYTENQLILNLSREDLDVDEINSLLEQGVNWDYLIGTASRHCVIPLVFKNIETHFSDKIPQNIFSEIQSQCKDTATYNFVLSAQVIGIINALRENDLDIISYKGMTLAQLAYKDISLRQFGDIDVMIRQDDFAKVKELLMQFDCRPAWDLTAKQEKAVLKYYYEYPFVYGENKTLLEVHWKFIEPFFAFDFDTKDIWERTQTVEICGKDVPTLASEDYLIVLGSHGSKHFFERFGWVCDVARLVENTEIDWDLMIKRAENLGSLRMVWLGLWMARETLQTKMPDEIYKKVSAEPEIQELGKMFIENIFAETAEKQDWKDMAKIHMRMREKRKHKLIYSKRLLSTKFMDSLFLPMGRPQ
ncbi:MAG: nucleotidyltransferase domain-containing protein [Aridibacter sp.]